MMQTANVPPVDDRPDWADCATCGPMAGGLSDELRAKLHGLHAPKRTPVDNLGAVVLADCEPGPPKPLLNGKLAPDGLTIAYGAGGAGKGTLSSLWAVQLADAGHRVLILDYENHLDEWVRRLHGLARGVPPDGVIWAGPTTAAWQGTHGPLWEQADDIRRLCDAHGITYVFIDSIVPACGAVDATKPEAPGLFVAALGMIGRPSLALGHVTKAGEADYPFGSVFWANEARVTWNLAKQPGDGHRVVLTNKKHNSYEGQPRQVATITYHDGVPVDVLEQGYSAVLADDIWEAMGSDMLLVRELVERLNENNDTERGGVKPDTVRHALNRGLSTNPKRFTKAGDKWGRA